MGSGCSRSVVDISSSNWKQDTRNSVSNTSTTNCSGTTIKTIAEAAIPRISSVTAMLLKRMPNTINLDITKGQRYNELTLYQSWSPFKLSRSEAEELLSRAEPGAFVFSHDMTSELFLSISLGKYVCHHAVLTRDQGYYVGARRFTTIGEVVDYFTDHPLGETTLKQECRTLPRCTSQVQIKQHPDITIPCPPNIATNGQSTSDLDSKQRLSTAQTTVYSTINQSQSPKITLTSYLSADDKILTEGNEAVRVYMETNKQQLPKNGARVDSLAKKALTRSMAIDRSDSSGEFQETPLSPLLPTKSSAVN